MSGAQPSLVSGVQGASSLAPSRDRLGLWLTMPAQLLLLFIVAFPSLMEIYISLTDWTPLHGANWLMAWKTWNWFANFTDLVTDDRFWDAILRTLEIIIVCVPCELLLGLGLALLFVGDFPGKRLSYSVLLMPMMIVPAVAGYMFFMLFQSGGLVNAIVSWVVDQPVRVAWLSQESLAMFSVMVADIWQWTPLMFLILLSGLLSVPDDQLRMAALLGAGPWQRFRTITLPRIFGVLMIALVIRVVEIFKIFDTLYIMTRGGPGVSTETISVYLFKLTIEDLNWSYVASLALFILLILSVLGAYGIRRLGARQ
jgi:multiple sugar transport system permease protein